MVMAKIDNCIITNVKINIVGDGSFYSAVFDNTISADLCNT